VTIIGIATLLGVAVLAVRTLIGKLPGSETREILSTAD
jgi:hypothetical protein